MTKVYFIGNKRVDLDSSEWNLIYKDGQWSDSGVNLFFRKKDDYFILEKWSNCQNERSYIEIKTRKDAIDFLLSQAHHPMRIDDAFKTIKAEIKEF